ncbi:MAG TPA: Crp/Fnr family transcriptional regulator [Sphingomicrobium sp.]|nr:Crp/Fnr family transcriptional regulator [Sphingomicrobium sp.]
MPDLSEAVRSLPGCRAERRASTTLFRRDDRVRQLHMVEAGCIHLVRYGEDGSSAVMQRATAGDVLAESSIFSDRYHCDALVIADAMLWTIDVATARAAFESDSHFAESFARHLAREVMRMRSRVEVLSRRTVQNRLDGWFALNGGALPPKGSWRSVAEDIGVSPEAFYRELQRRRSHSSRSRSLK